MTYFAFVNISTAKNFAMSSGTFMNLKWFFLMIVDWFHIKYRSKDTEMCFSGLKLFHYALCYIFPLDMFSGNHISLINFLLLQKRCFSFAKTIALLLWEDIVTIKCVNKATWVIFEGHIWQLLENTNIVCQIAVKFDSSVILFYSTCFTLYLEYMLLESKIILDSLCITILGTVGTQ